MRPLIVMPTIASEDVRGGGGEPSADILAVAFCVRHQRCTRSARSYTIGAIDASVRQKSTGAGAMSSSVNTAPMPSFSLIFFSISSRTSVFSRRNFRAFSLP